MKAAFAAVFTLWAILAPVAHAETLEDLEAAEAAVFEVWDKMPLTIRDAALITSPSQGFRGYFERPNTKYKKGETIFIYAEPVGFDWRNLSGDTYIIDLTFEIVIRDSEGGTYAELTHQLGPTVSQTKAREFSTDINLDIPSAPVGDYTVEVVTHDENSDESTSFELPFSIVE